MAAITLDGASGGNYPASDGSATVAKFRGPGHTAGFRRRTQAAARSSESVLGRYH